MVTRMVTRLLAPLLLNLLPLAMPAFAAGLDCSKATDPVDKKVCADPGLSNAEEKLADTFAALKALSPDPGAEQQGQASWRTLRQDFASKLPSFYHGRIEVLEDQTAEQRKEAPVVTAEYAQNKCIWFPLSLVDRALPFASRMSFKCQVDGFGEVAGSRGSITGPLYYQLKSYEAGGGTGFAIFELATDQKDRLKLLMAVNRDEVVRYTAPFLRPDSENRAWLVVPGEVKGAGSGIDGSSLYLFKNGLPHLVEGEELVQRLKALSAERR